MRTFEAEVVSREFVMETSVVLAERLLEEGRYDDADRIHNAAISSTVGGKPTTLRHRYRLIRSAIRRGELAEARRLLGEQEKLIAEVARLAAAYPKWWTDSWLGESHHLQIAWGEYYGAIGALGRSYEYRARATAALTPFLEYLGPANGRALERRFTHAEFEAELCFAAGRYRSALERLDECIVRLEAGRASGLDVPEVNLGQLYRLRASALQLLASRGEGDPDVARDALLDALGRLEGRRLDRLDLVYSLVKLELAVGDVEAARKHALQSTRDGLVGQDECLAIALRLSTATAAEREDLFSALQASVDRLTASWMEERPRAGGRGWLHYNKVRFSLNALVRATLGVPATNSWSPIRGKAASEALDELLPVLLVSDLARRMKAPDVETVTQLQRCMLEGETALLLSPGQLPGVGFLVDRDDVMAFPLAGKDICKVAIGELLSATRHEADDPEDPQGWLDGWRSASNKVAAAFFPGGVLEELKQAESVLFFARGLALQLPLERLYVAGEALSLQCSIVDVPTPSVLALLRGREIPDLVSAPSPVLIANVPATDWSDPSGEVWPSIRLAGGELSQWSRSLGGAPRVLEGAAGSVEAVRGGIFNASPLAVIYGHGTTVDDAERPSAVLLGALDGSSGNGRLGPGDVETIPVADTVILAACGSARAPRLAGAWGSNHLGGAFLLAGSRAVVLSASDLPAEPTARLVGHLLESLGKGRTLGNALLDARRKIASGGSFVPPSHYALPILFGLPEVRVVEGGDVAEAGNRRAPRAWWLLALAIVGLVAAWFRRQA